MASNLNTTGNSLLNKASGSIGLNTAIIRNGANNVAPAADTANALENLQKQVNAQGQALQQLLPSLQKFQVNDTSGGLIAWIGSFIVGMATYFGAWFKTLYVGGTNASNAPFVADANGNVTINGATITLNKNGVLTTLNNSTGPDGLTDSLTSQDVSGGPTHGQLTAVGPFSFVCWFYNTTSGMYEPVASLRSSGSGEGRILLSRINSGNAVSLATGGAGAPFVSVTDGSVSAVMNQLGVTVTDAGSAAIAQLLESSLIMTQGGTPLVTINTGGTQGVVALHNTAGTQTTTVRATGIGTTGNVDATGFSASGTPGISSGLTYVSSVSSSASTFVDGLFVSTGSISYTPGASVATFVSSVGSSFTNAITNVSSSSSGAGFNDGLRTS